MYCKIFVTLVIMNIFSVAKAQEDESIIIKNPKQEKDWEEERVSNKESKFANKSEFKKNLRLGGNFGLSSIDLSTSGQPDIGMYIGLEPQITYVFDDLIEGGLSLGYTYMGTFGQINYNRLEIGPILRLYPFDPIFLQAEWKLTSGFGSYYGQKLTENYSNYYVGGGYVTRTSETAYSLFGIKVNLIKNQFTNNQIVPSFFFSFHFGI